VDAEVTEKELTLYISLLQSYRNKFWSLKIYVYQTDCHVNQFKHWHKEFCFVSRDLA
jgi:hypothetical protein